MATAQNGYRPARGIVAVAGLALLAGCGGSTMQAAAHAPSPAQGVIMVTDAHCGTGWQHPTAGLQSLQIRNATSGVLEITMIGAFDGAAFAKLEGVGPGTTRAMPVDVGSGAYAFECDGPTYGTHIGPTVRVPGHVRGGPGIAPVSTGQMITATRQEEAYVAGGLATLSRQAAALAADIDAGARARAEADWLAGHLTFERLGSAYGMFGVYDDAIAGTPFGVPGGVRSSDFGGFYRLEYGLWHGQPTADLTGPANQLAANARALEIAWPGMVLQPLYALSDLALRTHEVLENAMQQQLSGEDNFGSGTNLATVSAGIDATRRQLAILHPLLVTRDPDLRELDSWLGRLSQLVDAAHTSNGWTPVADLTTTQHEQLDAAAAQTVELLAGIPPLFEAKPVP
jgi:iron uptake system component EfeO